MAPATRSCCASSSRRAATPESPGGSCLTLPPAELQFRPAWASLALMYLSRSAALLCLGLVVSACGDDGGAESLPRPRDRSRHRLGPGPRRPHRGAGVVRWL